MVNKKLIYNYKQKTLENNIKLKSVGDFINQRSDKDKIVIWGAGRLFDRLIVVGGLNPKNVFRLVDTYLVDHVKFVHGKEVNSPEVLSGEKIDTYRMFREYYFEIKRLLQRIIVKM